MEPPPYEMSLEALNRDSTKFVAQKFDSLHEDRGTRGTFIFLSAEPSILPLPNFSKYAEMKFEAEDYLRDQCPNLDVVVIRPGLVYSQIARPWSVPLGLASTVGSRFAKPFGINTPPGTQLSAIGDCTI